jgi:hypothetical protein
MDFKELHPGYFVDTFTHPRSLKSGEINSLKTDGQSFH